MTWNELIKALQSQPPELLDRDIEIRSHCYACEESLQVFPDALNLNAGRRDVKGTLYLE